MTAKQASVPCWSDFSERRRRSSGSSLKPRLRVSATLFFFVKSFWLEARLEVFTLGVAAECFEEQFNKYLQEA
jgi:hypothetical protein